MVAQVLLKIGQAEQQLEKLITLGRGVRAAVLGKRLHHEIRVRQKPIEDAGIHRPALLAKLKGRLEVPEGLLDVMVEAEYFLGQGQWNILATPSYSARTRLGHRHTPRGASQGSMQAACQQPALRATVQGKQLARPD